MFKLAHISDLHLHPLPDVRWYQLANKRLTGYLNWKYNRKDKSSNSGFQELIAHLKALKPDHVAITGDLVNLALPEEIERAGKFLEQFAPPADCSVIGGNHDAYVPGAFRKCIDRWRPFMGDDDTADQRLQFPYLRKRGDIAIIACNSADATLPFQGDRIFQKGPSRKAGKAFAGNRRNVPSGDDPPSTGHWSNSKTQEVDWN